MNNILYKNRRFRKYFEITKKSTHRPQCQLKRFHKTFKEQSISVFKLFQQTINNSKSPNAFHYACTTLTEKLDVVSYKKRKSSPNNFTHEHKCQNTKLNNSTLKSEIYNTTKWFLCWNTRMD